RQFLNRTAQQLIHFVDVTIACLLLFFAEASASLFFVLFTFALLAAALRWKWQAVVATAAAPAVLLLVMGATNRPSVGTADNDLDSAIIGSICLIIIAGMLGYVGALRERTREQFRRLAYGPVRENGQGTTSSIQEILAHTALVLEAPRI